MFLQRNVRCPDTARRTGPGCMCPASPTRRARIPCTPFRHRWALCRRRTSGNLASLRRPRPQSRNAPHGKCSVRARAAPWGTGTVASRSSRLDRRGSSASSRTCRRGSSPRGKLGRCRSPTRCRPDSGRTSPSKPRPRCRRRPVPDCPSSWWGSQCIRCRWSSSRRSGRRRMPCPAGRRCTPRCLADPATGGRCCLVVRRNPKRRRSSRRWARSCRRWPRPPLQTRRIGRPSVRGSASVVPYTSAIRRRRGPGSGSG